MALSQDSFTSLESCIGFFILMGNDTPVQVCGKGMIDINGGYFQNMFYVPSLSKNFLSIYHITHSCSGKKVVFTLVLELISYISTRSQVDVEVANLKSRLYTFSHHIPKSTSTTLLTHDNEVRNKISHKYFRVFSPFKA